jgi:hypothetical protein
MNITVRAVTDNSVNLALVGAAAHVAVQWQVDLASGNFSTPKINPGDDVVHLSDIWFTDMPVHTDLQARARVKFADLSYSAWTVPALFKTRRLAALGTSLFITENEGSAPAIVGAYGEGSGAGFVTPRFPELVVPLESYAGMRNDTGFRARMMKTGGTYDQSGLPIATAHAVRYDDASLLDADGTVTIIAVFVPEYPDLGAPYGYNIMGGTNASWWIYQYNGNISGLHGKNGLLGNPMEYTAGGALRMGEPNLLIVRHKPPVWHNPACPVVIPVVDAPLNYALWLNGVKVTDTTKSEQNGFGAYGNCSGTAIHFIPSITMERPLYVGHASVGAQAESAGGNHGFVGTFSEFAWAKGLLITDAQAAVLYSLVEAGNMDGFATAVKALNPLVYDRYAQPKRPEKPELGATWTP